jgi:hypothetical protein
LLAAHESTSVVTTRWVLDRYGNGNGRHEHD